MSYDISFNGGFIINPVLTAAQVVVLKEFADERHEPRQDGHPDGYYCNWVPSDDGTVIKTSGSEGFYCYTEWLKYVVDQFLNPWGCVINGRVDWHGESRGDQGTIYAKDNVVEGVKDVTTNPGPSWE